MSKFELVLAMIKERNWIYTIEDGVLYFTLGNNDYVARVTDDEICQEIIDNIEMW